MDTADRTSLPNVQDIDITVGHRTHELMWQQKVTNKELGAALGIDPTAIGKKLRANQKFSIEQLSIIAATFGTTIAYLVGEIDDPTDPRNGPGRGPSLGNATIQYHNSPVIMRPVVDLSTIRAAS